MGFQKILIIDDEDIILELLADLLADMGCELHFAKDGIEGLEKAINLKPDAILLDIMLPGIDGFQLCKRIRSNRETELIPVIMITGINTEESAKKGIEAGAEDVLLKPFNLSELKLRLKTILQLNRYRLTVAERNLFKWVVENSESGYVILNKDNKVTYLNSKSKFFLNFQEGDFEGVDFFDLIKGKFECVSSEIWSTWPNLEEKCYMVRAESSQGHSLWLMVESVPADEILDQKVIRLLDVTDEMIINQNMWQFENMVSHKLRTPLNGIIGALDALNSSLDQLSENSRNFLDEASQFSQRLDHAIRGIIDHLNSRRQFNKLKSESLSLEIIESYSSQLAITQGVHKILVSMDAPLRMRDIKFSRISLLHVLQELFDNAIKFHPSNKPTVSVNISSKAGDIAVITVSDDGRHVDPMILKKLGSPFFQNEKCFTGEVSGMGLGLSMINSLLKSIGGNMHIANRKECPGLVITLDIPMIVE